MLQQNPRLAEGALQDPRMIDVLGVLMGVDMQGFSREEGSDELPPGLKRDTPAEPSKPTSPPPQPSASSSSPAPKSSPPPAKVEEDVEMVEAEDDEDVKARKEAEAEKKLGSDAYKARHFAAAATHFEKAWETWPKDITFLTNLAGQFDSIASADAWC